MRTPSASTRRTALVLLGVLPLLALAACGGFVYLSLSRPYAGWQGARVDVVLEPGLDAGSMLRRLGQAGVLRHPRLAQAWLSVRGGGEELHAGEYRFERPSAPLEVLGRLKDGDVLLHPLTIPEGLTQEEVARRLVDAGYGTLEQFMAAFRDPTPVAALDGKAVDLEGYLFPDTYYFPRGAKPEKMARIMVDRFQEMTGADYAARAARVGLDVRGAVTLASLIERETSVPEERERISRVFHNRLARGMRLECDPTVMYALWRAGRPVARLTHENLAFASPWNTYVTAGLPPGPIANPGRASLLAAVSPAPGDELFFVAAPAGGHRFSSTLDGHRLAVNEWRRHVRSSR
jgi:UPF0755 protein